MVLTDWRYRTIGLHDFTTHKVISPAFGPTGDHRMEGILIATGPAFRQGAAPCQADLLDIAPTVLHLLGVPVPADMDGRILTELLDSLAVPIPASSDLRPGPLYQSSLAGVGGSGHGNRCQRFRRSGVPIAVRLQRRGGRRHPAAAGRSWLSLRVTPDSALINEPGRDYDSNSMTPRSWTAQRSSVTSRSHASGRRPTMPMTPRLIESSSLNPVSGSRRG